MNCRTPGFPVFQYHLDFDRRMLEPTKKKKKIPHVKGQGRSHKEMLGGAQSRWSQIPYLPDGQHTNWRVIMPEKFSHFYEALGPTSDFPTWGSDKGIRNPQGIWLWRSVGFDYKTSTGLGETETLGGHKQILACTRTQGKGAVASKRLSQSLEFWGSPVAACVGRGLPCA